MPLRMLNPAILVAVSLAWGCDGSGANGGDPDPSNTYLARFDAFWTRFDRSYSYFALKQVDWDAQREVHRPAAASVRSQEELIEVLVEMVAPLRDGHVWFVRPDGSQLRTFESPHPMNFDRDVWLPIVQAGGWVQVKRNLGYAVVEGIPYIVVGAWSPHDYSIDDLDAVVDRFRDAPAMIVDVRANRGGDSRLADALAGRFATSQVTAGTYRYRDGPSHDDFGPIQTWIVEPRGNWQYTGPVALLAGRASQSTSEMFVGTMREISHLVVMGDTTGGSSGNPALFDLGEGWQYTVSR